MSLLRIKLHQLGVVMASIYGVQYLGVIALSGKLSMMLWISIYSSHHDYLPHDAGFSKFSD